LSASEDATVRLWDVAGGNCLSVLEGHNGPVMCACLDEDGSHAVSAGADKTLRLWQCQPARCLWTVPLGEEFLPNSVSMTPEGRLALVGGSDGSLQLWNVQSALAVPAAPMRLCRPRASQAILFADSAYGSALRRGEEALARGDAALAARAVRAARCFPGRSRSHEAMDRWLDLYRRLPKKGLSGAWEQACMVGHTDGVNWACLHRDGQRALTAGQDGTLGLWEVPSARRLRTLQGHTDGVASACLGEQVALSGSLDGTLKLWDLGTGECLRTFHGDGRGVFCVCLFEPGGYALSGGADGAVRLWNLSTGQCLLTLQGHGGNIYSLALGADGRHAIAGASDGTMRLWDLAAGRCTRVLNETAEVTSVAMSADRRYALCGVAGAAASGAEGEQTVLNLWDLAKGQRLRSFWGHVGRINSACFLADGTFAISGAADHSVRLWHLAKGWCLRTIQGHSGSVTGVDVSGDGRYAISASSDHTARLWTLDWELEERSAGGWSPSAQPVLETFLSCHTPFLGALPKDGLATPEDVVRALTRRGRPTWGPADFEQLLRLLGQAGLGWIDEPSVQRELEAMAAAGPPWPRSPLDIGERV
jgi:WD40 repeat protein